ncbi:MAG TPA: glycosyltransferase family 4 protein [Gammaproteobacteria bacterium]|nr:glycosyltransferase family 4 protein [Gammaproteobacteria bacterium]
MNAPSRILYVVNDAGFFLSHRLPLAQAAHANGYEVHVATPGDDASKTISSHGYKFHAVPLARQSMNPLGDFKTFLCLFRLYKNIRPDIVHQVTIKPVIYGGLAARLAGVPAMVSALTGLGHIFVDHGLKAKILRSLAKVALRFSLNHRNSMVIFQNPDDRELFIQEGLLTVSNTKLIKGSGVDMVHFSPSEESLGIPLVVLASRMLWNKGVGVFVEAAIMLRDRVHARFALVGDTDPGNPEAIPDTQLAAWKDRGVVEFWGWRSNMIEVCRQASIICLPSYYGEGVPRILIEAAACGRPIVTTDTPGCREIVRHGVNGLLVPPRDSSALAHALKQLLEDPESRKQMGRAAREIAVAEFSLEKVVSETLAVYRQLLACVES